VDNGDGTFSIATSGSGSSSASNSSIGGGNSVYSNAQGDFIATANVGTKTITLSAYASTVLSSVLGTGIHFQNAVIKRRNSAGAVDTLPVTNVSFASNVLTLSDMTANFASGDTVVVMVIGPDKGFDEANDFQKVTQGTLLAGEDLTNNVIKVENRFSYATIATATTTTIKSGAGFLHRITVSGGTTGAIIVYDNTAASGTKIIDFDTTNALAS